MQGLGLETLEKKKVTLIKVMVAVFNLYVFKCLQDVHVNFMNPSVFVTQPSAKEKIDFPNEIETHTQTEFLSIFSGLNCYRSNRTCTPNSGLFILKRIELISQFSVSSQHLLPFFTYSKGFPGGTVVKSPPANAGDTADARFDPWAGKILWRRKWQPAPLFLPGKFHGPRSRRESDTTENTLTHLL